MGLVWAMAAVLIGAPTGVTAALQWGKTRSVALRVREAEVSLKLAEQNDLSEERRHQRLDEDVTRAERQLTLERAKLTVAADAELEAAKKLEEAAERRLKAAEADARAAYADDVAKQAAEDDKLVHRARMQALVAGAKEWAKSQPEIKLPNPFEGIDFERMFDKFSQREDLNGYELTTWDEFIGNSPERIAQAFAKAFAKALKS